MRIPILSIVSATAGVLILGSVARGAEPISLASAAQRVEKYEKIEFSLGVDRRYRNPFDPDEVAVWLDVTAPSGTRLSIPAFFAQDYQRRTIERGGKASDWFYPAGQPGWKARFAPAETGTYTARARLKDARGTAESAPVRFEATSSARHGFLRISRRDPRFFEFDDGTPLFAIGQNLAFIGETQYVNVAKADQILGKLAENGANFLRIWVCCEDWATAIEARKSAWGRSWAWKPPIVPAPEPLPGHPAEPQPKCVAIAGEKGGTLPVSPSHPLAVKPQTRYTMSGQIRTESGTRVQVVVNGQPLGEAVASGGAWAAFSREFTTGQRQLWLDQIALRRDGDGKAWLGDLSLKEADGGAELLWEADVNRSICGYYNPVDCFAVDQLLASGEKNNVYLQLTIVTRDLYMSALKKAGSQEYLQAIRDVKALMRYAVARWGYSAHLAAWEYFNEIDPGLPTDPFYADVGQYLESIDVYRHLRTTSCWHPSPKDWRHPQLDIAQMHHYLRLNSKEGFRDEVEVVGKTHAFLLEKTSPPKPALMAEFGLAENNFQLSRHMKEDAALVHFHNSLWASALSGASGTAMFWWWDQLDRQDGYRHYRPLAAFLADVPWTTAGLKPIQAAVAADQVRPVGLQGKDCAYVWLFNPQAAWHRQVVEKSKPEEIRGATLKIEGLAPGNYRAVWWDTAAGKAIREDKMAAQGTVQLQVPAFTSDIACKVVRD